MGKSAGKWIKTILFGKKHTKSKLSKHVASDKKTPVETTLEDPAANTPLISDTVQFSERGTDSFQLEESSLSSTDATTTLPLRNQGVDLPPYVPSIQVSDAEMSRQDQAATTAQAAFRGYLARRAFHALKGIIRLQALIRGHLVRRQAVATLRCMRAIVQLQALARGRMVRISEDRLGVLEVLKLQDANPVDKELSSLLCFEKLATNTFVRKLLIALPDAMPLALQYENSEPNSVLQWLERWSLSRFWAPLVRTKKNPKAKPQRKQSGEVENVKSKRTIRKVAANGDQGALASSEADKIKRRLRTAVNANQTELTQDQPPTELERVKRNLRRVSAAAAAAAAAAEKSEALPKNSQPSQGVETVFSNLEIEASSENADNSNVVAVDELGSPETPLETTATEPIDPSNETPIKVEENGVKVGNVSSILEDECKEESSGKEYQKTRKRNSLPAKHELYAESILQNDSPTLPSYMAATKSAKAKLRGHESSKFGEDGGEQGYNVRRHSLPALTSGKLSSMSPRVQKAMAQANGKRASKTLRSSTTSRDDKVLQPGWRR